MSIMKRSFQNPRPIRFLNIFFIIVLVSIISLGITGFASRAASEDNANSFIHARPSTNGQLTVSGTYLVDQSGQPVILKGISTHGLTWFPEYISSEYFELLSKEWDCNMIRLPMYTDIYCEDHEPSLSILKNGIQYAIDSDMYVLVDWHILNDYDPNMNLDEAMAFFEEMSKEYAGVPNIIYEICNEPNQSCDWEDVYTYCEKIIPIIQKNSPGTVIVIGTPDYDRALIPAVRRPVPFDNVMYVLHFYAATHYESLQATLLEALDHDLPVFISECGISEASGDGKVDYENAALWFNILHDHGISYAIWSFSDKNESSAMIKAKYEPENPLTDNDLTPVGLWVKDLVSGKNPDEIPVYASSENTDSIWFKISHLLSSEDLKAINEWPGSAKIVLCILIVSSVLFALARAIVRKKYKTYTLSYESVSARRKHRFEKLFSILRCIVLVLSLFFSMMYLYWRVRYSIPTKAGIIAIVCNIILLIVEIFGFIESFILYSNLISLRSFALPEIDDSEYPDVDIFIATYNEPTDLLQKTINACNHLIYPDKSKVHIWVCDDNRRKEMRALAESMNVGYFDRPDNSGAKAGNLNHAMGLTNSPLIVTLDADMIVKSDFLMKTVPYFAQARKDDVKLGLLQTPQCFYEPDIFQYALYSEKNAPNEQDFFYRTIEVAKTSTNSVIYGGSNTVLLRQALEDVGGFYTGSITEDFATGLLVEANGYVSLGLSEPLASGKTPDTFKDHIKQRIRWGRGVISTARKLHICRIKGLSLFQRLSYWSSVVYWYSPIKCLAYMLSPLVFALFGVPVFECTITDLLLFWFPMFIMQDLCLRVYSQNSVSLKWTGIYETSVMPFLFFPVLKELFGISTSTFAVTDKTRVAGKKEVDLKSMVPFIVLIVMSIAGMIRMIFMIDGFESLGFVILAFWIIRNLYLLIMSLFLIDGREMEQEDVKVVDADLASMTDSDGNTYDGITTTMSNHYIRVYLDEAANLRVGDGVDVNVEHNGFNATVKGVITGITELKNSDSVVYSTEILDYMGNENEFNQVLYDRIPSLPQSLVSDYGIITHLVRIIAHRILGD